METFIRFFGFMAGGQICAFSARLVSEGHPMYCLGVMLGTAFILLGAVLPTLIQADKAVKEALDANGS